MIRLIFIIPLLILNISLFGQSKKAKQVSYQTIVFWHSGPVFKSGDTCEEKYRKKYGFQIKSYGCGNSMKHSKKMRKRNKRSEEKMIKRHGDNWREEYNEKVEECKNSI